MRPFHGQRGTLRLTIALRALLVAPCLSPMTRHAPCPVPVFCHQSSIRLLNPSSSMSSSSSLFFHHCHVAHAPPLQYLTALPLPLSSPSPPSSLFCHFCLLAVILALSTSFSPSCHLYCLFIVHLTDACCIVGFHACCGFRV